MPINLLGCNESIMPRNTRIKTEYPGVFYIEGFSELLHKPEKVYYIRYRKEGLPIEEKAGKQYVDAMTPAKANKIRVRRITGTQSTNSEKRYKSRPSDKPWTITRLWNEYKAFYPKPHKYIRENSIYALHLEDRYGSLTVDQLRQTQIDTHRVELLRRLKPATVKNILSMLRIIVRFGARKGLCPKLSFSIEMPRVDNQKTETLTTKQLENLHKALDGDKDQVTANAMRIALYTGMRKMEILKLRWSDIDLETGFIFIRSPKGGKSVRIPINTSVRQVLECHPHCDSEYLFPGRDEGHRKEIRRFTNRIRQKAKLPDDFRPMHGLRHVFASQLASSGKVRLQIISELLTHKDIRTTMRYAHLTDERLKEASEIAGKLLGHTNERTED